MDLVLRGRHITDADLELIRALIVGAGKKGRSQLSRELCHRWNWVQADGRLKDAACRALLLSLQERKLIELPPRQRGIAPAHRRKTTSCQPELFKPVDIELPSIVTSIEWRLANSGPESFLYKDLVQRYHYLGYCREVGHVMRYIAYSEGTPIACLGWAGAAWKVACRDQWIGWTHPQRKKNLPFITNNARFLILPRVPHLASRLLAANLRRLALDWRQIYGYSPTLAETFVDTTRFKGTCYKAANWIFLGHTQGRGKYDRYSHYAATIKAVFVYPLDKDFRKILTHD